MTTYIQNDPTDPTTKRLDSPPLERAGSEFNRVQINQFGYTIQLPESSSPDDPITIFDLYYSPEIIDKLVLYINQFVRKP